MLELNQGRLEPLPKTTLIIAHSAHDGAREVHAPKRQTNRYLVIFPESSFNIHPAWQMNLSTSPKKA
jgi:hypothetical protein